MDEVRGTTHELVETPLVVPAFAMVNIGMGFVLLIRSGYFLSSGTPDANMGALTAVGIGELIVGFGLVMQMRWAWYATLAMIPLNLAAAVALWIMVSDRAMLIPVLIYGLSTVLLYLPVPQLRGLHEDIREWSATRWAKEPGPGVHEPPSTTRSERPLAA